MISRRDVLMLATAGFIIPSVSVAATTATAMASSPTRGSWPMMGGNAARSGVMPGPIPSLEKPIIVRWRYEPEDDWLHYNEPAVAEGVAYVRGDDNIYAINLDTGLELWRYELRRTNHITIAEGVAYATTYDGQLHAITADTGLGIWQFGEGTGPGTPTPHSSELSSPAIVDGIVTVANSTAVHALEASTGELRWSYSTAGGYSSPVISRGTVFGADEEGNFALDLATGEEQWRATAPMITIATVGDMVVAAGWDHLSGLDVHTGQELWRHTVQAGEVRELSISESLVLVMVFEENDYGYYDLQLQAIDIATGGLHWVFNHSNIESYWDANLRVVNDQVFIKLDEPTNLLLAIDATTGLKVWEYGGYITDVYPVAVDHSLYFVHDNELFAIGNLLDPVLISDVTLRAAPAESGLERGSADSGDVIDTVGARSESNGEVWVEISVGGVTGWVPASTIDPTTMPPEGDVWVIFNPDWF